MTNSDAGDNGPNAMGSPRPSRSEVSNSSDRRVSGAAGGILPQIEHVVVLMNENRSLDNLLGWVYSTLPAPSQFLPSGSPEIFAGLIPQAYSNQNPQINSGNPVFAGEGTTDWDNGKISEWYVPSPDPGEEFDDVTEQIFGGGSNADMSGSQQLCYPS